jgi:hypothetical protein
MVRRSAVLHTASALGKTDLFLGLALVRTAVALRYDEPRMICRSKASISCNLRQSALVPSDVVDRVGGMC